MTQVKSVFDNIKYCSLECEEYYPYYGVVPHNSFKIIDGKIDSANPIHDRLPIKQWQEKNFLPELEKQDDIKNLQNIKNLCGVYYCPKCSNGKKQDIENFYQNL